MDKKMLKLAPLGLAVVLAGCSVAPKPLTVAELDAQMRSDRLNMFAQGPQAVKGLTLDNAIKMALENNYELRLKMMEEAISNDELELAHYDMLPELIAGAGYETRSNQAFSRSVNEAGVVSTDATTSQEKDGTTANLTLAWNVLDFGVSYYQAQQTADQTLIAEQRRRKIVHNLVQQVRSMYWNAVGAQYLQGRVQPLLESAQDALAKSRQAQDEQLQNPLDALRYRKDLIELTRQLENLNDELAKARPELAVLLGLAPGTELVLDVPEDFELLKPELRYTLEEMEDIALSHRPELIEATYQRRISALETRKAMVRLLPGIEFSVGQHYDSNTYLVDNDWTQGGVRISWNLFNLLRGTDDIEFAKAQENLVDAQRMALNMAVLSQVHLSWLDYRNLVREFERARELSDIGEQIHTRMKVRQSNSSQSRLDEIKTASSALTEELRMYRAYAGLQEAYGRVYTTLGIQPEEDAAGGFKVEQEATQPELTPLKLDIEGLETSSPLLTDLVEEPVLPVIESDTMSKEMMAESVRVAVSRWAQSWRNQDVASYVDSYADDYPGTTAEQRNRWLEARRIRLEQPATISLDLDNVEVISVDEQQATVEFDQDYLSDLYTDKVTKTLEMINDDGEWKIVSELSKPR